jgi:GMP synthase-like glutamine amidotransferase
VRLLVLQHIACEHPGAFSDVMAQAGVQPLTVELDAGEPLPAPAAFDAVLAMGGPMSVNDDGEHPWLAAEKALVADAVRKGRPVLGVCLGAQLLAAALDAPVRPMDTAEVGLLEVQRTAEGRADPVLGALDDPLVTLQWHGDTFDLPAGAIHLAGSPAAANQAFRYGERAYGIQFHLEVTPEMAREWAAVPAYARSLEATLGAERGAEFLATAQDRSPALTAQARALFSAWLLLIQ